VKEPGALTRLAWFLGSNPILFLPVFAFAVMFTLWYVKGRDPDPGISVAPMYQPPEGMSPAECGALLSDGIHQRDITSTIVDLAVRGYIKIEETDEKHLFLSSKNYMFRLMKPRTEWSNLTGHERELLEGMFGGPALAAAISKIPRLAGLVPQGTLQALQEKIGPAESDVTSLAQLKNRFYVHLPAIQTYIKSSLKQKGMYGVDPDSAHGYALLGAVLIAGPFILLQWSGYVNFALSFGLLIVSAIVAAIIFFIFARIMPAKSLRGARTAVSIRGFQEFMNRVDRERLRAMPADTFEKFLPYAMALGVEEHWAHAFDGLLKQPPTWYAGPNMMSFNPMIFTHDIRTMTDAAGQTFVSAPRASSSGSGWGGGGGGGGGFSGGGFGGGGGGAF
jgi:uncharacterized membrane protein